MKINLNQISVKLLAIGALFASVSTLAQIEEVVVTAEFRETNVQDTPLAITAVSGDMLDARNQTNLVQISAQAPNVTLTSAGVGNGPAMLAFIRGVGQTDFNYAVEPGVGIYVDDVYFPTLTGSLVDLLDVSRVEILRGPQGTLAGRNSIGGSVKLFSKKPGEEEGGRFSITRGSFDRLDVSGAADLALSDNLYARISGVSKAEDGYVDRLDYACVTGDTNFPTFLAGGDRGACKIATEGGREVTAIRTALRWDVSDTVEINLAYDHTNEDSEPAPGVLLQVNEAVTGLGGSTGDLVGGVRQGSYILGLDGTTRYYYTNAFVPDDPYVTYATYIDPNPASPTRPFSPGGVPPVTTLIQWGTSGTLDWEINDSMSFKTILSRRKYESEWGQDADASPINSQQLLQRLEHEQSSVEVRLSGIVGDLLDYTVGAFWFDQDGTLEANVNLQYAALNFIHGPDPTPSTTQAIFANTAWHFMDSRLNVTAGLRYSEDEKDYVFFRRNIDGTIPAPCTGAPQDINQQPNCALAGLFNEPAHFEDDRTDWRLAVDFAITDDFMVYGQAATGYKAGGINPRPFFPIQIEEVAPEEIESFEFGFKSVLVDGRLRLNGTYFFNDYTDIQLQQFLCEVPVFIDPSGFGAPCLQPGNAGDAEVDGFEFEAELDLDNWIIDASLSTLDFEYTRVDSNVAVTEDMTTPFTPELKYSIGVQYTFELGESGSVASRLDYSFQDDIYANSTNADTNLIESYGLLGGRVTWASPNIDWEIWLEGNNLTDEEYYLTIFDQFVSSGTVTGTIAKPRTWAIGLKHNF